MALGPTRFDPRELDLAPGPLPRPAPDFGGETRDVNALRARTLWIRSSVRLLADLIEVTEDHEPGLQSDHHLLVRARLASPALLRSAQLHRRARRAARAQQATVHRIWVTKKDGLAVPLEAMTHVLAHAISRQFGEPTTVVTFEGRRVVAHHYGAPGRMGEPETVSRAAVTPLMAGRRLHRFFVAPDGGDPRDVLGELHGGMHRIVYLTDTLPKRMPPALFPLLFPATRRRARVRYVNGEIVHHWTRKDEGPFFSSFIAALTRPLEDENFATTEVDVEVDGEKRPLHWRVERDHCRVWRLDPDAVQAAWDRAGTGPDRARRLLRAVDAMAGARETAERWARAVTNRSVGIALSGGGASSYAVIPLLRGLAQAKVPIDVFSGVSGGAFLGAYYCRDGLAGLERAIRDGVLYQFALLPNTLTSAVGGWVVDHTLGKTLLGQTEVRFAPVTVRLEAGKPPRARRVVSGTLGDAVQVSGAAPLLFAPVSRDDAGSRVRYADGALALLIPARILRDVGADLLFACNCIAGPRDANPIAALPGVRWIYDLTPLGGLSDLWVSATYMQQRFGRAVNPDVSAFFEPPLEAAPGIMSAFFAAAGRIVRRAECSQELKESLRDFERKWRAFAGAGPAAARPSRPTAGGRRS
ncbi:hypothetical protein KF840_19795 [bacterium]|nr:hypothetical protein [bacterium]